GGGLLVYVAESSAPAHGRSRPNRVALGRKARPYGDPLHSPIRKADFAMSKSSHDPRPKKRFLFWTRRPGPPKPARRRVLLEVEALETRLAPSVVTIGASKDNTIFSESVSQSDGAGPNFFAGTTSINTNGAIRRGLIAFDVAGNVPAGATINSV